MKSIVVISFICMQFLYSHGLPRNQGVGAYAYQDSSGNRYGGTYGLKDGQLFNFDNDADVTTFGPGPFTDFQDLDAFFPEYFMNLKFFLQEAFEKDSENQRVALNAAQRAFEATSNRPGYVPLNHNYGFDRFPGASSFGFIPSDFGMPQFGQEPFQFENRAFAGGAVGPGYQRQAVGIDPPNPQMPNVDVSHFAEAAPRSGNGFYSVSSSSYASSDNVNGKQKSSRGGETVVNNNGKITKYSLHN